MARTLVTLTIALALLGCTAAYASDDCRVTEYPDRIEASCMGTPASARTLPETSTAPATAPAAETVPKEPTVVSSTPQPHNEFTEQDPGIPLLQTASSHQQRRIAADLVENARAARLQKIMNSRQ